MADQKMVTLNVTRFDPDVDQAPREQAYTIPFRDDMVVLDALNYIKEHVDGSVTFRWSCRMGVCGADPIAVLDIQRIIRFLKERGIGVLITDHNVRETLGICDHAYIINEGAVLAAGRPDEIVYNESVRRVYLGENFRL